MTIKVGEKEYCLDGYANTNELQNALVECYQQGRADRLNEIFGMKFVFETEGKQKDITELVQRVLLEHFNNCEVNEHDN